MKAYGKPMIDLRDITGFDYPSRRMFGRKRLKALKRKLRSRKKYSRDMNFLLDNS